MSVFLVGIIYRVIKWSTSPVPFHIPTIAGQQKSLPWIKDSKLESPHNTLGVIGRMAIEILFFRSLFRNTKMELKNGPKLVYGSSKYLWLGAIVFHWSMLIIVLRHLRLFMQPIPPFVIGLDGIDGFFQIGLPFLSLLFCGKSGSVSEGVSEAGPLFLFSGFPGACVCGSLSLNPEGQKVDLFL
jgi:hypothetical protein